MERKKRMKRGVDTESETSHRNHQVSGMEEKTASARGGQPAPSPGVNGEQVRNDGAKRPLTTPLGKSGRKMNSRRMPPGSAVVPVGSEAGLEWSGWSLVPDFAMRLAREFGLGAEWLSRFIWFLAFVALLAPAFLKVAVFYLLNPRVKRSIVFGVLPRNRLDIISPPSSVPRPPRGFPVVVFVTGGAWLIGYKAWGSLLGKRLAEQGILVALLDYRNFPQGTVHQMTDDVTRGICWVMENAQEFGGDPDNVHLAGQSAGAHIASLALAREVIKTAKDDTRHMESLEREVSSGVRHAPAPGPSAPPPSPLCRLRSFVGISGTYNVADQVDHFHGRGLYRSLLFSIMGASAAEGRNSLDSCSAQALILQYHEDNAASPSQSSLEMSSPSLAALLPRIVLMHGTEDRSIPPVAAAAFADALEHVGATVTLKLLEGKTHVDPIVLDPLRGGRDVCVEELVGLAKGVRAKMAYSSLHQRPIWLPFLVDCASSACPF